MGSHHSRVIGEYVCSTVPQRACSALPSSPSPPVLSKITPACEVPDAVSRPVDDPDRVLPCRGFPCTCLVSAHHRPQRANQRGCPWAGTFPGGGGEGGLHSSTHSISSSVFQCLFPLVLSPWRGAFSPSRSVSCRSSLQSAIRKGRERGLQYDTSTYLG